MKKEFMKRLKSGIFVGITIGYIIPVIISLCIGDGIYYPCAPELINTMGNEVNAVIFQIIISAVIGGFSSGASVVYENRKLSVAMQTAINFLVLYFVIIPISYLAHWMEHSIKGFLYYNLIFIVIYILIWIISYLITRAKIRKINKKL